MDPLITNGIDPALLRVLEKRGQERDQASRRRRPPVPGKTPEEVEADEENPQAPGSDQPKHTLDDLA